jgi:soluble lytic murein transglycosylase
VEVNRGLPSLAPGPPPADPGLQRADELLHAGLPAEAGFELERAEESLTRRVGRERALALLLDRYPHMLAFHRAYQLAEARGAAALSSAPEGPARRLWEAAYPRAFSDLVERYAPSAGSPPFFVYSIMRKETGFYPYDVSYADARGLLQLIPQVGQQMADQLAEPFHDDDLYQIATNVRLGARYLGQLVRKFQGSIFLAAGAYNGGEKAMMRWCDLNGRRPFDEFLELMTFDQTREYVKRVIGIYAHYLYLYKGEVYELPIIADARYSKDGPE